MDPLEFLLTNVVVFLIGMIIGHTIGKKGEKKNEF